MTGTITVTASSGTAVIGLQWELGRGGVADDGTTWLGGGATYPGTLTPFEPRQTDGSNDYQGGVSWITLSWTGAVTTETLTLSGGDVSSVLNVTGNAVDNTGAAAAIGLTSAGLVITLAESATAGAPVSVDCSVTIICT